MKALNVSVVIERLSSKKDRSLSLTMSTPELTSQEKALFMDVQGQACSMLITPIDEAVEEYKVDKDIVQKTQSQRIRNVLYILWKQGKESENITYEDYYKIQTEKIIEYLKGKIIG